MGIGSYDDLYKSIRAELLRRASKGIFGMKRTINISRSIDKERKKLGELDISSKKYEIDNKEIEVAKFTMPKNLDCILLSMKEFENKSPANRELMVCREASTRLYKIIIAYECDTCRSTLEEREAYLVFDIKRDNPIQIIKIVPNPYKDIASIESKKLKLYTKSKVVPYLNVSRLFDTMNKLGEMTIFFELKNMRDLSNIIQKLNDRLRTLLLEIREECKNVQDRKICYFAEDVLKDYLLNYHLIYRNIL